MNNTKNEKVTKKVAAVTGMHTLGLKDLAIEDASVVGTVGTQFALWIRVLLQGWRQGTVGCKGRSDVNRTNKKPWKQKGTGRARAGSARSPLWRGGGVTFGPQPRTRTLRVTKNLKQDVLKSMLFDFLSKGKVVSLDWAPSDVPNTKAAYSALKEANLTGKTLVVFVSVHDMATQASLANIPNVHVISFDQPNAMFLARSDYWVFLAKDTEDFKGMASRWI